MTLKLIVMRLVAGVFIIVDRSAYGNPHEWEGVWKRHHIDTADCFRIPFKP
ncbi:MAG: hypothetical protein O6948_08590 [Deltaproteobacteria bacterium]|nr:hypothetical protein [Deltaproteobacteria bacterium]